MTLEDTQNKTASEQESLIAEMLRDAQAAPEPGTMGGVVHKGDGVLEAPMVALKPTSAGYVYVWDTRTYEKFPVLYYMLAQKLRRRREDGSYRFATTDPKKLPVRGTFKCLLHADGENRKHYSELGFRVCPKSNISNAYQVQQHMKKKHPQEWAAIEEERKDKERKEDRELQRLILSTRLPQEPVKAPDVVAMVCPSCSADFTNKVAYEKHIKEQHS